MRIYGKIESGFWQNPKVASLGDDLRLLLLYLYTCPHGNSLGCFVLHQGYIAADMRWSAERVSERVSELVSKGFIDRDETTSLTRVVGWFDHNTIDNGNVAKAAAKTLKALPRCDVFRRLVSDLNKLGNQFLNPLLNEFRNEYRNKEPNLTEPEPKPEPEASGGKEYAFAGRVIRLLPADFDRWRKAYHAIPDLAAELTTIDAKFNAEPPADWFVTASAWLGAKHQKLMRERDPPRIPASRRAMN